MRRQTKKLYYSVHALRDETIVFAFQTRKPVKSKTWGDPQIDEDGIHRWFFEKDDEGFKASDIGNIVRQVVVATSLNTKRAIRRQVEGRLDAIEAQLAAIREEMGRMENRSG